MADGCPNLMSCWQLLQAVSSHGEWLAAEIAAQKSQVAEVRTTSMPALELPPLMSQPPPLMSQPMHQPTPLMPVKESGDVPPGLKLAVQGLQTLKQDIVQLEQVLWF